MGLYDPLDFASQGVPSGRLTNDVRPSITSLAFPPTSWTYVEWGGADRLTVDITMWRDFGIATAVNLPISLIGGVPKAVDAGFFIDDVIESVSTLDNSLTLTAHAYRTGDGPFRVISTGELPGGLDPNGDYWIRVRDANSVELHTGFGSAMSNGAANDGSMVNLQSAGTGTRTIRRIINKTRRVMWMKLGELDLTDFNADLGWSFRFEHQQNVKAYALAILSGATTVPALAIVVNLTRQRTI